MSTLPRTEATPFDARLMKFLAGAGVLSFAAGMLLAILGGHVDEVRSHRADTFSRSAVGYRGLLETLRRLDVPHLVSRWNTAEKAGPATTLVLLEPRDAERAAEIVKQAQSTSVVVVLPKWEATPDREQLAHVSEVFVGTTADALLAKLELEATTTVVEAADLAADEGLPVPTPAAKDAQAVVGGHAEVVAGAHALVATFAQGGKRLLVVADADLFNNAGLGRGANAALALELLRRATDGRTLVFDETANGYVRPPRVFAALFEFPLVLVVLHAAMLLVALLWAAMRRFGAPEPAPPAYARGREALMESIASLLEHGGHSGEALRAYWRAALGQLRDATGAPAGHASLIGWLDRVGAARGFDVTAAEVEAAVDAAARSGREEAMVRAARAVHTYRERMLGAGK